MDAQDIQQWIVQLLDRYSSAYASIQFRALRQFFKWRDEEDEFPDPMARLRAPKVTVTAVLVFTSVELSELGKACQGRSFAARRDAAIIAVFTATGIRLSELAGIRYHPGDPARSDLDLHAREIRIRGKGGTARTVRIGHQAARSLDRYLPDLCASLLPIVMLAPRTDQQSRPITYAGPGEPILSPLAPASARSDRQLRHQPDMRGR